MFSFSTEKFTEKDQRRLFLRQIFRRVFLEDWGTKLIALGITLALWLGVTGLRAPTSVRLRNVALNTRVSNDKEIVNTPVREVDIVITGDKRKLDRLDGRDLIVSIDLTDVKQGDRIVQLSPETVNLDLPNGLKLDEIQPNKIAVRIENVIEREIELRAASEGAPAEGFEVYSARVLPSKVRVRGAESIVNSLETISTETIGIEGKKEGFTASQVGLNIINPKITALDTIVDVIFRIGEKRAERVFIVLHKTDNKIASYAVTLFGARSQIEKLRAENLSVEIQKSETGEDAPKVILPEEFANQIEVRKVAPTR